MEIEVRATLGGALARKLVSEAAKRGMKPIDLFADLIVVILENDLVQAVMDD